MQSQVNERIPDKVESGIALLYCPHCKTETKVQWYGKLSMKRCWRCDDFLVNRSEVA